MNEDYQTGLARARRIQTAIIVVEFSIGASVALVVGIATGSIGWSALALVVAAAFFVAVGSLAFVLFGVHAWLRRRSKTRGPQG